MIASFYWFGRVDGRLDGKDFEQALAIEATRMTAADMQLEGQRCGAEMSQRGQAMQKMGEGLTRRAERAQTR